jgi:hypothetical protein
MKPPAAKGKITQPRRSRSSHRAHYTCAPKPAHAPGPTLSYLQTRVRASRLYQAAFILAIIELTRRLHQAYEHAYDKQAADWVLPQNTGKAPLNTKAAKLYDEQRLGALGRLAFSPNCRKFLADHGVDVKALIGAVRSQNPFDGTKSTITRLAAGVVDPSNPTDVRYGGLSVRSDFNPRGGTMAETGVFPGGTLGGTVLDRSDVYFRSGGINTATIIHEALHSLLGETDSQIQTRFGISTGGVSDNITQELRKHDCAE